MEVDPNSVMVRDSHASGSGGGGVLRDATWTIPLVAVASLNVVSISLFEAFILAKTLVGDGGHGHYGSGVVTVSRRHFFLGQALLLGLFGSSLVGLIFVAPTTPFVCGVTRQLGVAIVGAATFAPLLVKCVFLISLHGGVYLPSAYLALLLMFAVAVQLALSVQWLFLRPPDIVLSSVAVHSADFVVADDGRNQRENSDGAVVSFAMVATRPMCNTSFGEVLSGLCYVLILLIGVLLLSIKSRRIRDNYRESVYIAVSSICALVVWTISILVALVNGADYEDSCLAFALEATAAIVFLVMFAPKGRQLAAMGREGLYVEDQEVDQRGGIDGDSMPPPPPLPPTATTPPALYSTMRYPGFYHFPTTMHRRPAFVPCDPSDAIYRIPGAVPDHKCHKKIPASFGAGHCRRHVVGPQIYKSNCSGNHGHGHQTLPNNSMLY